MFAGLTNIPNCDNVNRRCLQPGEAELDEAELEIFAIFAWPQKNSEKQRAILLFLEVGGPGFLRKRAVLRCRFREEQRKTARAAASAPISFIVWAPHSRDGGMKLLRERGTRY